MMAQLFRIVPPEEWWNISQYSDFFFRRRDGTVEAINARYVPIDCRAVGTWYELQEMCVDGRWVTVPCIMRLGG